MEEGTNHAWLLRTAPPGGPGRLDLDLAAGPRRPPVRIDPLRFGLLRKRPLPGPEGRGTHVASGGSVPAGPVLQPLRKELVPETLLPRRSGSPVRRSAGASDGLHAG